MLERQGSLVQQEGKTADGGCTRLMGGRYQRRW